MIKDNLFPKVNIVFSQTIGCGIWLLGIPVVFAEELDEKIEQTHTPLVMRIEKAPVQHEQEQNPLDKSSLWICFVL